MALEPLTIAVLSLAVAVGVLLLGPGIGVRAARAVRVRLRRCAQQNDEIFEYLSYSAIFLQGLPHFITHTWSWGPSVPNYGVGVPPETPFVSQTMPSVCGAVRDAQKLYERHSGTQGRPYVTLDETLQYLKSVDTKFWQSVEALAKSRWPLRWRAKLRTLRALQIPTSEHDRIRSLELSERG